MKPTRKVIIIGSGPAAHTAAIYTSRALLEPLLFEGFMAGGIAAGGQLTTTSSVENFPGFPQGIDGPLLMSHMREQSTRLGTEIITETVESIDIHTHPFTVTTMSASYTTLSIIIATGATANRLRLPNEDTYWDKGISACAICDGALPIFRDKPLIVVGGGDSACEEAEHLTKFGSKVYMAVRRNVLRASKAMQDRIARNNKIKILWNTELTSVAGDENTLQAVDLIQNQTKKTSQLQVNGLFYAVGHTPNTAFLNKQVSCNDQGYIITSEHTKTSIPGVFACGDVQDSHYRQAITAAGSGCMAALDAEQWLISHEFTT